MSDDYSVRIEGFKGILFDKREMKKAIRAGAVLVRTEARRLISRREVSAPGEFPGYQSGVMSRSISIKIGSGGGYAKILPTKKGMKNFYPAFLEKGNNRGLKPRKNFMIAALDNSTLAVKVGMHRALEKCLVELK